MPNDTAIPLSGFPYFSTFDSTQNYDKILFKPSVSVQTRELNDLQSMVQNQIEWFADNIFSPGTIVQGCNFVFYNPYPYAKIKDLQQDGNLVNPSVYKNLAALNANNGLKAQVVNFSTGFESTDPALNTLYLRYLNSGTFSNVFTFSSGDVLTIFDPVFNGVEDVIIANGGLGFSNSDTLVALSQLQVAVTSGTFNNGDFITNGTANVQIVGITNVATNNSFIQLKVAPRTVDLANAFVNSTAWTISNNANITDSTSAATGVVVSVVGQNFFGVIVTNPVGTIINFINLNKGAGYVSAPFVSVRSVNNTTGYASLSLIAQNYVANVTIAGVSNAVGNGYGFGVTEGIIFQKGYFVKVFPQTIIVNNYSQSPNGVSAAFQTSEQIITSNIDPSLNDPAAGDNNNAPGADRLKLTANLVIMSTNVAISNTQIFPIVSWNAGNPVRQQQQTIYSTIGDNMAQRTYETSGNYVVDQFLATTRSPVDPTLEGNTYSLVVDPGLAYIDGFRVETFTDFTVNIPKSYSTFTQNNYLINISYGNYVVVNNVAGTFKFNIGDTVFLYTSPKGYLSNTSLIQTQNTTPQGTLVGNANIRSLTLFNGQPGQPAAQYKMYLYNVQLANGVNFSNVASIFANNTLNGICDVVLTQNPNNVNVATAYESNNSTLVFPARVTSLKNANNVIYNYRTINTTATVSNVGISTIDISGAGNEFFPYTFGGSLTSGQLLDLYVVPNQSDYVFPTTITGTVTANTSTANLVGSGTTFLTTLAPTDYIFISANSTGGAALKQVQYIVNNTLLILDSATSFTNTTAVVNRVFPKNVPMPFGFRSGLSANVNAGGTALTLNFGANANSASALGVDVGYNAQRQNITQSTKTANRLQFVKINLANNVAGLAGPWCLGVPDIFRLRGVWIGSNSSVSNTGTNFYQNFFIDHNQTTDFYDLGFLFVQPNSNSQVSLSTSNWLLVEFDYFSPPAVGFVDTVSYVGSNVTAIQNVDSQTLATLTSNGLVSSFEVPELFSDFGTEIDLLNYIDFRPYNANSAAPSTLIASAPVNPAYTFNFGTNEKKFPQPGSNWSGTIEYYLCRTDSVIIDQNAVITVNQGTPAPASNVSEAPLVPAGTMELNQVFVPPYPSIEKIPSLTVQEVVNTRVLNQRYLTTRLSNKAIQSVSNTNLLPLDQPKVYTMADIGDLDRRLSAAEYYISLNQLESNISSMFIGSSSNTLINRFKFGYFTDDFTTPVLSDLNDPQYTATKEGTDIVPSKLLWDVNLTNVIGSINYIETEVVGQEFATIGNAQDPNTQPVCALSLGNTVAYATRFRQFTDDVPAVPLSNGSFQDSVTLTFADLAHIEQYFSAAVGTQFNVPIVGAFGRIEPGQISQFSLQQILNNPAAVAQAIFSGPTAGDISNLPVLGLTAVTGVGDLWQFFPSAQAPPVSLYFYCYDTPTLIQVFQGNTFLTDSGSAQNLTAAEQTFLTSAQAAFWFNDQTNLFMKNFVSGASNTVQFAGKITWNYNFNASNKITINTTTSKFARWKWVISFPINGSSVGCIPPPATWDKLTWHCTNGLTRFAGYVPDPSGLYALTSSTSQYDITTLWAGGANSVVAPGIPTSAIETSVTGRSFTVTTAH